MEEKMSDALEGTEMLYTPSTSALAPVLVPLTWMEAKGIGSPVEASLTVPLTATFCAESATPINRKRMLKNGFAFFISI